MGSPSWARCGFGLAGSVAGCVLPVDREHPAGNLQSGRRRRDRLIRENEHHAVLLSLDVFSCNKDHPPFCSGTKEAMRITRKEFWNALGGTEPAGRAAMNQIKEKLAKGEKVL